VTKVSPGGGQSPTDAYARGTSSNHFNFFDSNASFGSFGSLESAAALPSLPSLLDSKDKAALAAESAHRDATVTSTSRGPAPLDNGRLVPPPPSNAAGNPPPRQGAPAPAQQSRPAQQSAGAASQQGRPVARGQPLPQQQPGQPQPAQQQQPPQPSQAGQQQQQQQNSPTGQQQGGAGQSNALVSAQSPENKRIINPVTVPNGQNFVDITEYLNMPQSEAAKKLGIPPSTLSKRWKEAVRNRKWPWRVVCKLDKEIMTLLHNVPQGAPIPEEIEGRLGYLMRKRQEELKPVVIRL
jgi:hypothetical protein